MITSDDRDERHDVMVNHFKVPKDLFVINVITYLLMT